MKTQNQLRDWIYHLEERLLQPEARKGSNKAADLIADDFIEFGSSGRVYDKQQALEAMENAPTVQMAMKDFKMMQLAPDIILATYSLVSHDNSESETIQSVRSSIWKFIGQRWQIIFHQGTITKSQK